MAAAAATTSSNRFTPLSESIPSPANRSPSPSPPDACQRSPSRCASPSAPPVPQPYRTTASRLDTYPLTWTHKDHSIEQLAFCGFCYTQDSGEDECICHICNQVISLRELVMENKDSNNDLLCYHGEDCILADTIYDLINSPQNVYSPNDAPQSRPPPEQAAASPPSPLSAPNNMPIQQSPSPPRPVAPAGISYASIAARPPPIPSSPSPSSSSSPSRPPRSPASTPLPARTQAYRHSQHRSSPVLSIHDLERRFQNKSSPFFTQRSNHTARGSPSNALSRLLHAVADLLGPYNPSYTLQHDHYPFLAKHDLETTKRSYNLPI
jgi:hypothetical protein